MARHQGKRIFSGPQWACLSGHMVRERDLLAASDPASPRVRPTLPRLSILSDSNLNRAAKLDRARRRRSQRNDTI
jgi:hypothetical protein